MAGGSLGGPNRNGRGAWQDFFVGARFVRSVRRAGRAQGCGLHQAHPRYNQNAPLMAQLGRLAWAGTAGTWRHGLTHAPYMRQDRARITPHGCADARACHDVPVLPVVARPVPGWLPAACLLLGWRELASAGDRRLRARMLAYPQLSRFKGGIYTCAHTTRLMMI